MAVKLRKPFLVAGLGISAGLWLWESLHEEIVEIGEWGLLAAIVLGSAFWVLTGPLLWRYPFTPPPSPEKRNRRAGNRPS